MSTQALIDQAIALAKILGPLVPGLTAGAAIAEKVDDLLDTFHQVATPADQAKLQAERQELRVRIVAKARAEASALRQNPG